ncbi:U5 small nuclear ribonucleoprotein 40 kDa protein [Galleria mellonella]|uniref:U5 small nuclear ribonucleoprotein 40 kDa protein n=1 Tax=Galleria mellonella TaxID=7137 RepID=A0A6J1WRN0_GALME|nr:U5 small nuclear ribonucleoprotein 40 kDa protein [Galleria mellonella]
MPEMEIKRKADDYSVVPAKRTRHEISVVGTREKAVVTSAVPRTSNLYAPIMLLEGHQGEIFSAKFHPEGKHLASAGFDRQIFLWNVYGQCENVMVMSGHTGAIMELCFSPDGSHLYTCATDNTVAVWDVPTGTRIKKLKGHSNFVNSVSGARRGPELLVSASDDNTIKLWDARKRNPIASFDSTYPVTSVLFNDTAEKIISGGIDNVIKVWDIRNNQIAYKIKGHTDTVTGLSLSSDGSYLLSNSMDNTLRIWDVRPFAPSDRCVKLMSGHQHNFEKNLLRCAWSPDGSKVSAGSADRFLYVWDTTTRRVLYRLPGHNGSLNDVHFHPTEPIVLSASSDKQIYLGEIEH